MAITPFFVLIVLVLGVQGQAASLSVEFVDRDACELAAADMRQQIEKARPYGGGLAGCYPKATVGK